MKSVLNHLSCECARKEQKKRRGSKRIEPLPLFPCLFFDRYQRFTLPLSRWMHCCVSTGRERERKGKREEEEVENGLKIQQEGEKEKCELSGVW